MNKFIVWLQLVFCSISFLSFCTDQKPFVIVIASYNNAPWCIKNLESALNQKYDNYRIQIIDDCSTDGQDIILKNYIDENQLSEKVTFICNKQRHRKLYNMYHAVHSCQPHEIVLELDGDDFLAHDQVLARFNEVYSKRDVWLVHAYYEDVRLAKNGWKFYRNGRFCGTTPTGVIQARSYRRHWYWSGLRSYYAWLYQKIAKQDLIMPAGPFKGQFFPTSSDRAVIYPMLEMAGKRIHYISESLLHRNVSNPINDGKVASGIQRQIERILLNKRKQYPLL